MYRPICSILFRVNPFLCRGAFTHCFTRRQFCLIESALFPKPLLETLNQPAETMSALNDSQIV